jgi:hypothetical protein
VLSRGCERSRIQVAAAVAAAAYSTGSWGM